MRIGWILLGGAILVLLALGDTTPASAREPRELAVLVGHTEAAACLAFSPDGQTLA